MPGEGAPTNKFHYGHILYSFLPPSSKFEFLGQ